MFTSSSQFPTNVASSLSVCFTVVVVLMMLLGVVESPMGGANAYKAAAIEHVTYFPATPVTTPADANNVLQQNINLITPHIVNAADSGADLVVLSEMAFTSLTFSREEMRVILETSGGPMPAVYSMVTPTTTSSIVLLALASIATSQKITIVFNFGDRLPCSQQVATTTNACPSDGHWQYNTELAISPTGQLVAKYYKLHTFNATEFDTPPASDPSYFLLVDKLGAVTPIGLLVCFDTMFARPMQQLMRAEVPVEPFRQQLMPQNALKDALHPSSLSNRMKHSRRHNSLIKALPTTSTENSNNKHLTIREGVYYYVVNDFTVSHWWVNQNAMMNAVTFFQGVSRTYNVNLIVAATVWSKVFPWGSGSGIFSGGVVLQSYYRSQHQDVILGNDMVLVSYLPPVKNVVSNMPPLAPYINITSPPVPVCVASTSWKNSDIVSQAVLTPTVPILKQSTVKCQQVYSDISATFLPPTTTTTPPPTAVDNSYWVSYLDYGYYFMHDGGDVYYFEYFASLYFCYDDTMCLDHHHHTYDDHLLATSARLQSINITINLPLGAAPILMASNSRGNVRSDMNGISSFASGTVSPTLGTSVTSIPTVAALKVPVATSTTTGDEEGLINFSLLARHFQSDAKLIK